MKHLYAASIGLSALLACCFGDDLKRHVVDAGQRIQSLCVQINKSAHPFGQLYGLAALVQYAFCLSDPILNCLPVLVALMCAMMAEPYLHWFLCLVLLVLLTLGCQLWCMLAMLQNVSPLMLRILMKSNANRLKLLITLAPLCIRAFLYWAAWLHLSPEGSQILLQMVRERPVSHLIAEWTCLFSTGKTA